METEITAQYEERWSADADASTPGQTKADLCINLSEGEDLGTTDTMVKPKQEEVPNPVAQEEEDDDDTLKTC